MRSLERARNKGSSGLAYNPSVPRRSGIHHCSGGWVPYIPLEARFGLVYNPQVAVGARIREREMQGGENASELQAEAQVGRRLVDNPQVVSRSGIHHFNGEQVSSTPLKWRAG